MSTSRGAILQDEKSTVYNVVFPQVVNEGWQKMWDESKGE